MSLIRNLMFAEQAVKFAELHLRGRSSNKPEDILHTLQDDIRRQFRDPQVVTEVLENTTKVTMTLKMEEIRQKRVSDINDAREARRDSGHRLHVESILKDGIGNCFEHSVLACNAQQGVSGDHSPVSNVVYTSLQYDELNDLDRIARFVLAVAHSANYSGTDREQRFVGQRTVAVAITERGDLVIAQNGVLTTRISSGRGRPQFTRMIPALEERIRRTVYVELEWEYAIPPEELHLDPPDKPFGNISWVANHFGPQDTSFHAEMQLVSCLARNRFRFEGNQIGVSKPCCLKCANRLGKLGIDYSYYHTQSADPWVDPGVKTRWW